MSEEGEVKAELYPGYNGMLYAICQEEGIKFQLLSLNWVKRLEKSGKVRYIVGYKFDLNPDCASRIADDKYAAFCALEYAKIPAVEHEILYDFNNQCNYAQGHNSYGAIISYFQKHDQQIVMKPLTGTGGRKVHKVTKLDNIPLVLMDVFHQSDTLVMSPFYDILHEYRVIMLDGEARLSYMKTITDPNEWRFNLQNGASAEEIPAEKVAPLTDLAKRAMSAIGLRFGSVDIIETGKHEFLVLEINSGVMTKTYIRQHPEQYGLVREIYRDAIKKMFKE